MRLDAGMLAQSICQTASCRVPVTGGEVSRGKSGCSTTWRGWRWHCPLWGHFQHIAVKVLSRTDPLGRSTRSWSHTSLHATDHRRQTAGRYPLGLAIQSVFGPPHCPLIQPVLLHLFREDVMGDSDKILTEVYEDNIHCSPFAHPKKFGDHCSSAALVNLAISWSPSNVSIGIKTVSCFAVLSGCGKEGREEGNRTQRNHACL